MEAIYRHRSDWFAGFLFLFDGALFKSRFVASLEGWRETDGFLIFKRGDQEQYFSRL